MRTIPIVWSAVMLLASQSGIAEIQIEELILGPASGGGAYVVAPDGARAAYVGMKGTSLYVSVDGKEGPLFDEFYTPHGGSYYCPQQTMAYNATQGGLQSGDPPVIFSLDGEHYAYAGRQGQEYVVIHDGKEIARGPRDTLSLNYGPLTITPKGRHVYWDEMEKGNRSKWRLIMTGKAGPWSGHQTMTPVFSGDESRYAYNAGKVEDYQQQILVVDGKQADYVGYNPVFTADGKLLLAISHPSAENPKAALLANGKPAFTCIGIKKIVPGPVGSRYAAIVTSKIVNLKGVDTLFIDGKEVPGTEGAQNIWFTPDGKHWAAACTNTAARSMFMVIDGKPQKEYSGVAGDKVYWTPDGSRCIYTATAGGRPFLIVNDQEFAINYLRDLALPETGSRYAFSTYDGSNRNFTVMIEGQSVLPAGFYPVGGTLRFSPDGSRYGYLFGPIGRNEVTGLVIDGQSITDISPAYFSGWMSPDPQQGLIFSPDSKHVAYLGVGTGIYIDGKLAFPHKQIVHFPAFTPDSQHFIFAVYETHEVKGKPPYLVAYVDGQRAVRADGGFFRATRLWHMDNAGVVTYLAADGDVVKRFRITASPDRNLTMMASEVEAQQAEAEAAAEAAKQQAIAEAEAAKQKAAEEAAAAKAAQEQRAADALKARQEAIEARTKARQDALKLRTLNAQRARQGLPPLTELPPESQ